MREDTSGNRKPVEGVHTITCSLRSNTHTLITPLPTAWGHRVTFLLFNQPQDFTHYFGEGREGMEGRGCCVCGFQYGIFY